MFPLTVVLADVANGAAGRIAVDCAFWKGGMRISPGVGNTPANQTVTGHGKFFGCNRAGEGARFSATLQMSRATCANLAMSGTASFDWVNGGHSTGFLIFHPQAVEPHIVRITGSMTSGLFQGLVVNAWLRFKPAYSGTGANCSPTNLLRTIDFTNVTSFRLLTPKPTTTTQPATTQPPTTQPHGTTPNTPPPTVPITNFGGPTTAPATFAPPITVVFQSGPPAGNGGVVAQQFPQGTLAFTGSSSGLAAMFGFEALLVGGALACLDPERRRRRWQSFAYMHRPKKFLQVTLPPMH